MSCGACARPFGLLRREHGCPSCGFAFCSKCLNHKIYLHKLNAEAKVCMKCYVASKNQNQAKSIEPPDAFLKRMESLENPARPPITVYEQDKYQQLKRGLSVEDQQIVDRLQKLKDDREPLPKPESVEQQITERLKKLRGVSEEVSNITEADIQARLTQLKGLPETQSNAPAIVPFDNRTEQEQSEELFKQYMEEAKIDKSNKEAFDSRINDIESRLHALAGKSKTEPSGSSHNSLSDSEDEEVYVKKVVDKIKAEVALDPDLLETEDDPVNAELPWCEICNEDAKMRCLGCKYLFCKNCYLEHKDDDDGCNKYEPYQKPTKP